MGWKNSLWNQSWYLIERKCFFNCNFFLSFFPLTLCLLIICLSFWKILAWMWKTTMEGKMRVHIHLLVSNKNIYKYLRRIKVFLSMCYKGKRHWREKYVYFLKSLLLVLSASTTWSNKMVIGLVLWLKWPYLRNCSNSPLKNLNDKE